MGGLVRGGQWGNSVRTPGLYPPPYSFTISVLGLLMSAESQDLGLTPDPKDGGYHRYNALKQHVNINPRFELQSDRLSVF